jgi:hypothetical protein
LQELRYARDRVGHVVLAAPWMVNRIPSYATVCPHCTREIDTIEQIRAKERERKQRQVGFMLFAVAIIAGILLIGFIGSLLRR